MSTSPQLGAPLARRRLLDLLGITPYVRRGRTADASGHGEVAPGAIAIVLVDRPDAAAHPLLRAILATLGMDPESIRVAGTPLPAGTCVLLSIGADHPEAAVSAPPLVTLARDPMAKRALWRSLRPLLRRA